MDQAPTQLLIPAAATLIPVAAWILVRTARRARFFTLEQRSKVGYAFRANCIWRPSQTVLILPGIAAGQVAWTTNDPRWMSVSQGLLILSIFGFPMIRVGGPCGGTIQGGHQWPHKHRGTTSIWNCEPACEHHNGIQSARWSFLFAFRQWGPISLAVYTWRNWIGTSRLAWMWARGRL